MRYAILRFMCVHTATLALCFSLMYTAIIACCCTDFACYRLLSVVSRCRRCCCARLDAVCRTYPWSVSGNGSSAAVFPLDFARGASVDCCTQFACRCTLLTCCYIRLSCCRTLSVCCCTLCVMSAYCCTLFACGCTLFACYCTLFVRGCTLCA